MSPVTETVLLLAVICLTLVVLGLGWMVYLAKGGRPFDISFRGLGLSISINRSASRSTSARIANPDA